MALAAELLLVHANAQAQDAAAPTVVYPNSSQSSDPLWTAPPARATVAGEAPKGVPLHPLPQGTSAVPGGEHANEHALQTKAGRKLDVLPAPAFQGIVQDGYLPSDSNIAVGTNDIVEVVNSEIAVFDKNGVMQAGYPKSLSSLWAHLGGACAQNNSGDPVVQYDRLVDRWIVTQLASLKSPYAECIAVSQSGDPTLAYNLYSYSFGTNLNDYPKFGVWPTTTNSAYLATYNLFANGSNFVGADLCAYDRTAMLAGAASPASVCFQVSDGGVLPSDLDGPTAPNDGEPGYFLDFNSSTNLALRKLAPNFANPKASTLSAPANLGVASFQQACNGGTCIPQPSTNRQLDSLGDRLMYRLAYRNFGTTQSMVVNHSIVAGSSVGPRWYELDSSAPGVFAITQQGTYAPDSSYRWMGSIAMDQSGDIALGYSLSSTTTYPSVVVTGRTLSDPAGTMESETVLQAGAGSQTGYTRWGDYSSMRIDPSDDCTFWYTNQYLPVTSSYNWYTYIGSFKFAGCGSGAGTGAASFTLATGGTPVRLDAGASESASSVTVLPTNGYDLPVSLSSSCSGATITCSLNPPTVTSTNYTSALTVSVSKGASSGVTTETITASDGTITKLITFTVTIPSAQFGLGASVTSLAVSRGGSKTATITATDSSGSTNSPVALTVNTGKLPRGASANLSTSSISSNGGTATLTVTAGRNSPPGSYSVIVNGNDGNPATLTVPVTIQ